MDLADTLARIAETQIGTRGDLDSGRAALYGYLLATDAHLGAFQPEWKRQGFGTPRLTHASLLNPNGSNPSSGLRLLGNVDGGSPHSPFILRIHSWCAAFVDWCVLQLLLTAPNTTALPLSRRPRTAVAFNLLNWGKSNGCSVFMGSHHAPLRGDIVVFSFSHTGVVVDPDKGGFFSVEGNTTLASGGNQGYIVERRRRRQSLVKGIVRLPPKMRPGDYEISPMMSRTA
jgi:hypothetical protein